MEHKRFNLEEAQKEATEVRKPAGEHAGKEMHETDSDIIGMLKEQQELRVLESDMVHRRSWRENPEILMMLGQSLITNPEMIKTAETQDTTNMRRMIERTMQETFNATLQEIVSQVGKLKNYLDILQAKPVRAREPEEIREVESKIEVLETSLGRYRSFKTQGLERLGQRWVDDFTAMVQSPDDLPDALAFSLEAMEHEFGTTQAQLEILRDPKQEEHWHDLERKRQTMRRARDEEERGLERVEAERYDELRTRGEVHNLKMGLEELTEAYTRINDKELVSFEDYFLRLLLSETGIPGDTFAGFDRVDIAQNAITLYVEEKRIGSVIGTGGRNIKRIEDELRSLLMPMRGFAKLSVRIQVKPLPAPWEGEKYRIAGRVYETLSTGSRATGKPYDMSAHPYYKERELMNILRTQDFMAPGKEDELHRRQRAALRELRRANSKLLNDLEYVRVIERIEREEK